MGLRLLSIGVARNPNTLAGGKSSWHTIIDDANATAETSTDSDNWDDADSYWLKIGENVTKLILRREFTGTDPTAGAVTLWGADAVEIQADGTYAPPSTARVGLIDTVTLNNTAAGTGPDNYEFNQDSTAVDIQNYRYVYAQRSTASNAGTASRVAARPI